MTRATRKRLDRLRDDLSCPHCDALLADPPIQKLSEEDALRIAIDSFERLPEQGRSEAEATPPPERTLRQWCMVVETPWDANGVDIVDHLTRLRDEVASHVR